MALFLAVWLKPTSRTPPLGTCNANRLIDCNVWVAASHLQVGFPNTGPWSLLLLLLLISILL